MHINDYIRRELRYKSRDNFNYVHFISSAKTLIKKIKIINRVFYSAI